MAGRWPGKLCCTWASPLFLQLGPKPRMPQQVLRQTAAAILVLRDPDEAYDLMKRALDAVRAAPALSDPCRERLQSQLEWALRGVVKNGVAVKQLQVEWLDLQAEGRARAARWRFPFAR